jgi:hypothetical protein
MYVRKKEFDGLLVQLMEESAAFYFLTFTQQKQQTRNMRTWTVLFCVYTRWKNKKNICLRVRACAELFPNVRRFV